MDDRSNEYVMQEAQCADPVKLVELLFQRAVRDLRSAIELWPTLNESPAAIHMVVHAQCILRELQNSLNMAEGGELSIQLARIYEYMQFRLSTATARGEGNEEAMVSEVLELLSSLSDAWTEACRPKATAECASALSSGSTLVA